MANQNDSFIDEVTDELRRDRLFAAFRRFGWIAIALIVALVGGAAWYEWQRAGRETAAQAFGDAIIAAEAANDAGAFADIDAGGNAGRRAVAQMLAADQLVASDQREAAAAAFARIAQDGASDPVLADLAQLKQVMIAGNGMNPSDRDAILTHLSRTGAPYELLALEQKAVALIGAGRTEDAITLIRQIQDKDALTQGLRLRLSEMMITLGVEPDPTDPADTILPDTLPPQ